MPATMTIIHQSSAIPAITGPAAIFKQTLWTVTEVTVTWKGLFVSNRMLAVTTRIIFLSFIQAISIAPLKPLLVRGAPDTPRILCRVSRQNATGNCEWRTCPTWRLERDSNPRPFGQKRRIYQSATTPWQWTSTTVKVICRGIFVSNKYARSYYTYYFSDLRYIGWGHYKIRVALLFWDGYSSLMLCWVTKVPWKATAALDGNR